MERINGSRRKLDGLTLIELLLALIIVGLLAAVALPSYERYVLRAKIAAATADIVSIEAMIERFHSVNRKYPGSLAEIRMDHLRDPWDNPYQFLNFDSLKGNGKGGMRKDKNMVPVNTDYDLYSMGEDGRTNQTFTSKQGRDDIVRANNGGYVGLASEY
ncbi:general secretion pathway protein G [Halopseudomonas xinjiangensis]|uniref:General secretion pathway protein G n=1 Tax=Halopseudomonas xinjiangensis TaxID=487184 RepID=A0A1H1S121_9GAMM|nr:type IV pilin protein [Halopseudomonas xinjiangensis]SDS40919.1 general secretion pathway protein G [Halopseudomonas xinjiangensis]